MDHQLVVLKSNQQSYREMNKSGQPCSYYGDKPDWLVVYGITRDSNTLEESNYQSILKKLKEISEEDICEERASHWAVGYIDTIIINNQNEKLIQLARELITALIDYPVVDESDLSERELEKAYNYWDNLSISERINEVKRIVEDYHWFKMPKSFIKWYKISFGNLRDDDISEKLNERIMEYIR